MTPAGSTSESRRARRRYLQAQTARRNACLRAFGTVSPETVEQLYAFRQPLRLSMDKALRTLLVKAQRCA